VASQKLTKDRIDRIRAHNPDFVVVQYHKAYGVDQGGNIIPGSQMQQFVLPDTLGRYAFSGGGRLVDGQKPDMTLELAEKVGGEIAVQPGRAMILSGD
jgi:hypothetical protein